MKLAIIGSREFKKNIVIQRLDELLPVLPELIVISGGARGVDSYAEEWCKEHKVAIEIIKPINPANKMDYLFRNVEIITKADTIFAFWNGKSKGTKFVIDYAKARGFAEGKDMSIITQ